LRWFAAGARVARFAPMDNTTGAGMKEPTIKIGRREFTAAGVMALLSGVAITISACGSTSTPSSPSTGGTSGDLTGTVSANHGHTATITAATLTAKDAVTLDIRGSANHTHSLSLSGDQVASAAAGQRISMTSSTDDGAGFGSHSHVVTFN
jgi:hypothetical protein